MSVVIAKYRKENNTKERSPVATKTESVVLLPGMTNGRVVVTAALAKPTILLPNARKTAGLAALVDGVRNPGDAGVATNLVGEYLQQKQDLRDVIHTALWLGSTRMTS